MLTHAAMKLPMIRLHLDVDHSLLIDHSPSPAWKANNLSALLGAMAAVFIAKACSTILDTMHGPAGGASGKIASLSAALLFALSPLIWEYSITTEVFALNNLICSMLLHLTIEVLVRIGDPNQPIHRLLLSGALLSGLALTNQHTSLIHLSYLIAIILSTLLWHGRPVLKLLAASAAAFTMGLSPYLYLYLSASRPMPGSWGDTSTISGLLRHMLRAEYGTFQLGFIHGRESALRRITAYLAFTSRESYHVMFVVLALGVVLCIVYALATAERIRVLRQSSSQTATTTAGNEVKKGAKKAKQSPSPAPAQSISQTSALQLVVDHHFTSVSVIAMVVGLWMFYVLVWHGIFSNLPLDAPMPYGVHARFWMQPSIPLYVLLGVTIGSIWRYLARLAHLSSSIEAACLIALAAFIIYSRFGQIDKSSTGDIMHRYAASTLDTIPEHSLLLSHTDLDWNPMRYLRTCEPFNKTLTHLSIQLIPYEWFPRQMVHYPQFQLPDVTFPGVATGRMSEGNAQLIMRLLAANGVQHDISYPTDDMRRFANQRFPGGVYLDMQAINEGEIGNAGEWRGYTLMPWGTQYRVFPLLNMTVMEAYQVQAADKLVDLEDGFVEVTFHTLDQYPIGTWEAGAISVYYDAHYQLGLHILTYAIVLQSVGASLQFNQVALLLDRLVYAADLLTETYRAVGKYETISSSLSDVTKNTALAHLRLVAILKVIQQLESKVIEIVYKETQVPEVSPLMCPCALCVLTCLCVQHVYLNANRVLDLCNAAGRQKAFKEAKTVIGEFIAAYPEDRDVEVFRKGMQGLP